MKKITGSEVIAKSIAAQGIRYVFTVQSRRLDQVIGAIKKERVVDIVRANTETAAAAMADGYARRTRRIPVVLTEDRGAALSQISAVTNAWADKIPLLSMALCSDQQVDVNKGVFRESFDQNGVFQPVTHWRKRVESIATFPQDIAEAIRRSGVHKMGPVHLDIPAFCLTQKVDRALLAAFREPGTAPERQIQPLRVAGDEAAVRRAVRLMEQAERPLLLFGGGLNASGAYPEALAFMERCRIPTATTMGGIGVVPVEHELCLGGPSYAGGEVFHVAIKEADLVIAVGVGFSGLEGFGRPPLWSGKIKFVHVDISPYQFGLNVNPEVSILGDAKTVLAQFLIHLSERDFSGRPQWERWRKRLSVLKSGRARRLRWDADHKCRGIHQGKVAQEVGNLPGVDDLLVVIDGGNTPLFAAMYAPLAKPLQAFFPFGMAALGAGIPYAIGVQLASPERRVILVTGDGSFMYNVQELETLKRLKLPVVIIVNNDSAWNMIRAMQDSLFARNYVGTLLPDIDYARVAQGFGLWSRRITKPEEIVPAYHEAMDAKVPALIDCVTDPRNLPDALLSFALVEFEGSFKDLDLKKVLKSLSMMRDNGFHRSAYMLTYIVKALLRIDPIAKLRSAL